MLTKKEYREIISTGLILFLITAVSAGLLAGVNAKTAPIIEKNLQIKKEAAMKLVLPAADSFDTKNLKSDKMDKSVREVYKSNNNSGYVVMVSPNGYGGEISIAVGIGTDGRVSGASIISQSETAGLGAKCVEDEFISQFRGKSGKIVVKKGTAKENEINAISSATITSKAVTSGVNAAIEAAKSAKEGN